MHAELWSYRGDDGHMVHPPSLWILSRDEKRELTQRLGSYRMPTRYGANLRQAFGQQNMDKWPGYLKTHDYHRLLQHILPVAIIGLGTPQLQKAI